MKKRWTILVAVLMVMVLLASSIVACTPAEEEVITIRYGDTPMGKSIPRRMFFQFWNFNTSISC